MLFPLPWGKITECTGFQSVCLESVSKTCCHCIPSGPWAQQSPTLSTDLWSHLLARKWNTRDMYRKGSGQILFSHDGMFCIVESKKSTKRFLELKTKFSNTVGYKNQHIKINSVPVH